MQPQSSSKWTPLKRDSFRRVLHQIPPHSIYGKQPRNSPGSGLRQRSFPISHTAGYRHSYLTGTGQYHYLFLHITHFYLPNNLRALSCRIFLQKVRARHHRLSTFAIVSNFLSELLPAGMDNPSRKATGWGGYGQQSLDNFRRCTSCKVIIERLQIGIPVNRFHKLFAAMAGYTAFMRGRASGRNEPQCGTTNFRFGYRAGTFRAIRLTAVRVVSAGYS